MVQGLEPGTTTCDGTVLDDSLERVPPETLQGQDRDLTFFNFDVTASGLHATDAEMCATGVYMDPASGEKREFFGCDVAVVTP